MPQTVDKTLLGSPFSLPSYHLCQFFQIHAGKRKPDFHFHPGFSYHLCIAESVVFFCCSEEALYGLFPLRIHFLHPNRMPDILTLFHVRLPDMPGHYLHMIPAFCALLQIWTSFTDDSAALVFPVSGTVRRMISQHLMLMCHKVTHKNLIDSHSLFRMYLHLFS